MSIFFRSVDKSSLLLGGRGNFRLENSRNSINCLHYIWTLINWYRLRVICKIKLKLIDLKAPRIRCIWSFCLLVNFWSSQCYHITSRIIKSHYRVISNDFVQRCVFSLPFLALFSIFHIQWVTINFQFISSNRLKFFIFSLLMWKIIFPISSMLVNTAVCEKITKSNFIAIDDDKNRIFTC